MFGGHVRKGAAWMDEVKPSWYQCIDTDRLDMVSIYSCVAGQAFADEYRAEFPYMTLASGFSWVVRHQGLVFASDMGFSPLTGTLWQWRHQVNKRVRADRKRTVTITEGER